MMNIEYLFFIKLVLPPRLQTLWGMGEWAKMKEKEN